MTIGAVWKIQKKNGNSITNCDDQQKIIPVTADDDDDVTKLSKNQNIEQELTKELLS
ncbi:3005_t:CDS:1, partial [Dentiscutata heterogama]